MLPPYFLGCSKMSRCKARKNRIARRIIHTLSCAVCSATPDMGVFQQLHYCGGAITITSFIDFWSAFSMTNVMPS
jgi:hypothetical protein